MNRFIQIIVSLFIVILGVTALFLAFAIFLAVAAFFILTATVPFLIDPVGAKKLMIYVGRFLRDAFKSVEDIGQKILTLITQIMDEIKKQDEAHQPNPSSEGSSGTNIPDNK